MAEIPAGLKPHFQEYDLTELDLARDADLIIQRALEFGDWDEQRWLFGVYGMKRIRRFIRQNGERCLRQVTFNFWRKLLKVTRWCHSPFPTPKGELWNY